MRVASIFATSAAFALLSLGARAADVKLSAGNIDKVVSAMTLEEKAHLLVGGDNFGADGKKIVYVPGAAGTTHAIDRLGIPAVVLTDGPAGGHISSRRKGVDGTFFGTGFPVGVALASSWNTDLVESVGKAIGNEAREYGCDVLLAPAMNIHRTPLCGRNFEYYSEDPVLAGQIAAAYVRGVQREGVGTSVKHFSANCQETNRINVDEMMSRRALREIYLKPFEIAVKSADPWTVMSSYNKINGTWTQSSRDLLTTILRDEWQFKGIVMTDWTNERRSSWDRVAAGNELLMPGHHWQDEDIIAHVKDGSLPMSEVDARVKNFLRFVVRTPRFRKLKYSDRPDLKAHAEVTRQSATEGMVLLKNDGNALPLSAGARIALCGARGFIAGGTGSGDVNKPYVVDLKTGLANAGFQVVEGGAPENCDAAVFMIARQAGEGGDRRIDGDFNLKNDERDNLQRICFAFRALGKKTVVVLNTGSAIETASWKVLPDAILLAWQCGQEGGNSVADVLGGKVSPSGKLTMTFPNTIADHPAYLNFPTGPGSKYGDDRRNIDYALHEEGIYVGYRYYTTFSKGTSYPFGYGLSYTTFKYDAPRVTPEKDGFRASVKVTNTGKAAGKEVVQLYVKAPKGSFSDKPVRELKAFAKTRTLGPGESQTLSFKVDAYSLASFDARQSRWETAAGKYQLLFAASSEDIRASAAYTQARERTWQVNDVMAPDQELVSKRKGK